MKIKNLFSSLVILALTFGIVACGSSEKEDMTSEDVIEESEVSSQLGGLALYTVRDAMAADPRGTLQKVAEAGYAYIEAAGYADGKFYGMEPVEFKEYVESLGMKAVSTHMGAVTLDNADQFIADTKAAGMTYFVIPVPPMGMFTFDASTMKMGMNGTPEDLVSILNELGEKCSAAGLTLLYHNHDFEFMENEDGVILADYILENTDAANVNFEIDLFWSTKAGAKANDYFAKYPGRFKAWHVKDMNPEGMFAPVGKGLINFSQFLVDKETAGLEVYFVEQDMTFDLDPLEAIKISNEAIRTFGFE